MKRFEFSLNKLKGYKQQVLDREKNDLAHLRRQQQQYIDEKNSLEEKLRRSNEEFCEKSARGMTVMHITSGATAWQPPLPIRFFDSKR